jgi:hypothetical protein
MRQNKVIGAVSATTLSLIVATLIGPSSMHIVYADANCAKAGSPEATNPAGNNKGNDKQCAFPEALGPKEPVRDCDSPNKFKDNDADGDIVCRLRGN